MEIIDVMPENLAKEHICCAISDKKGESCVSSKKAWLAKRFAEGLVFKKVDVRGKAFIEYMPAEKAWCPLIADGYLYIHCFWVSGQWKGKGYGDQLLEACVADAKAKGKLGLTVLSSPKKMTFLSDPGYLKAKGFRVADTAAPFYELLYLPFRQDATVPRFAEGAKAGRIDETGMVLYYSNQCPHTEKYAPLIEAMAKAEGLPFKLIKLETREQAQNAPAPFTTYSFFDGGRLVGHEIFSEKKFATYLKKRQEMG